MLWNIIRFFLFLLPPESAHNLTIFCLKHFHFLFPQRKMNPFVGIAAGFDKNADVYNTMSKLGFGGMIEIGTITPKPQKGNPKPRVGRNVPSKGHVINFMGFPNVGALEAANKLSQNKKKNKNILLGANIGKNKDTPLELAYKDYVECIAILEYYVDYFTINISSPNTPRLKELQGTKYLDNLLRHCRKQTKKSLYIKISPDLNKEEITNIVDVCLINRIQGIIATNTLNGISGSCLKKKSLELVKYLAEKSDGQLNIIGVGGIASKKDIQDFLDAGAMSVQVYTGLIYNGYSWV